MTNIEPENHEHHLRMLNARPARAYPFGPLAVGSQLIVNGAGLWVGIGAEETTGAAVARLLIQDGVIGVAPQTLMPYTFAANESRSDIWPSRGVLFLTALTVQVTVGSVGGALHVVLMTRRELAAVQALMQGQE